MKDSRLSRKKYINDPVCGSIGITELEWKLIDTPVFQRLRGLRQLGRVNFVFPGAEHSRFVHSLGVLYNMGILTDMLLSRGDISEEDTVKMRVAALLHDIGHYPLSHLGEAAYGHVSSGSIVLNKNAKEIRPELYELCSSRSKAAHHERLGQYIVENNSEISQLLKAFELDPAEIGLIFNGEYLSGKLFYSQLIHSSMDADRLDYLIRDSFQTGVRYGMVDLEYLARLARVIDKDNERILVFDSKGRHVVEHFLMSRFFHYSQVVYHKTDIAFEGMIKALYIKLLQEKGFLFNNLDEIHNSINDDSFLSFTDSFLDTSLYNHFLKTSDKEYRLLYEMYRDRKRPKVVYECKDLYEENKMSEEASILKHFLRISPDKISEIVGSSRWGYSIIPFQIERIHGRYKLSEKDEHQEELREAIKMYDSENDSVSYLAEDKNSILHILSNYTSELIRIYVIEEEQTKDRYGEISEGIRKLIFG